MRRKKRFSIGWIALGLAAVAIVPVTAGAKPMPTELSQEQYQYQAGAAPTELSQEQYQYQAGAAPVTSGSQVEIPYLSHGKGVTSAELGFATGVSPDDRGHARSTPEAVTIVATDDGSRFDLNPYVVSGFGLALLLLAGGMGIAIRHSRKTTLSPA